MLFGLAARLMPIHPHPLCPPEGALLRTNGFCGASGEATARGVNLYEDMVAACFTKGGRKQHRHRPKRTKL